MTGYWDTRLFHIPAHALRTSGTAAFFPFFGLLGVDLAGDLSIG